MTGSKPPESPDRATPDADDLAKTRYGDPYSPPSAAGSPSPNAEPNPVAVQPVRAITIGAAPPVARPARAAESEPPAVSEQAPRPGSADRTSSKPPMLPSKRRSADSAPPESSTPSAASLPPIEPEARRTPEPERARGGADVERSTLTWQTPPSPRLRMSRTDVFVPNPSLARRMYPRDTVIVPPRRWSLWPALSLSALGVSVVALGVVIATLAPRSPTGNLKAAAGHAAAVITDHNAATQAADDLAPIVALPEVSEQPATTPLTAAEPTAPRTIHRDAPPRRPHVEQLPPPVPASASKHRPASPDASMVAELERAARDRLAEGDYATAKRIYERLRVAVPARREYAAMVDLLTTRLASCGQPGAPPCSPPKP